MLAGTKARIQGTTLRFKQFHSIRTMSNQVNKSRFCSPKYVLENIDNVKIIDSSWYLPFMKRNCLEEFTQCRIKNSVFLDIDKVKDTSIDLPHMLPKTEDFNKFMDENGISNDDQIIVYDSNGFLSSCRVLWHLEAMGHKNVLLLEGGLPLWKSLGYPTETGAFVAPKPKSGYNSQIQDSLMVNKSMILDAIKEIESGNASVEIVDARPFERFIGKVPEPRPGLTCGHMPGAKSLPSTSITRTDNTTGAAKLLDKPELLKKIEIAGIDLSKKIYTSCGSGVTASVLYVAFKELGVKDVRVYDGSWAEYGLDRANPLATGN